MNHESSNNVSYRQLGRLAELKVHNENSKRIFGRDITNLDKRLKKNTSIYEKVPVASKPEVKVRSRSLYGHKEALGNSSAVLPCRDAIGEYRQEVIDFMARIQKAEPQDAQKQVTEKMRQILIDWMVDVHDSFELKEQTLHLALSYLADYSALREISKEDYQLAGIACLWIASKYEEIYPPRTRNYIEVTADTYSVKDLKSMEGSIIEALGFDLNRTTALQLLEGMLENGDQNQEKKESEKSESHKLMTEKAVSLCKYAIESALFEGLGKKYTPLVLVMGSLHLAESVLRHRLETRLQPSSAKVGKGELADCFKDLCLVLQGSNKFDLTALRRKYGKSRHHQVAKIKMTVAE